MEKRDEGKNTCLNHCKFDVALNYVMVTQIYAVIIANEHYLERRSTMLMKP